MNLEIVIYVDRDYKFNTTWLCGVLTDASWTINYTIEPKDDCNYLKIYWR